MFLRWSPPVQDGGSPVRVYTVEKCKEGSDVWEKAETAKQPFITVFHLEPQQTFRFRVKAENVFGVSEPSDISEPVSIKEIKRSVTAPVKPEKRSVSPDLKRRQTKKSLDIPKEAVDYDSQVKHCA